MWCDVWRQCYYSRTTVIKSCGTINRNSFFVFHKETIFCKGKTGIYGHTCGSQMLGIWNLIKAIIFANSLFWNFIFYLSPSSWLCKIVKWKMCNFDIFWYTQRCPNSTYSLKCTQKWFWYCHHWGVRRLHFKFIIYNILETLFRAIYSILTTILT